MLNVHYALGALVLVTAVGAIFYAPARRYVLYLIALQIVAGALTWWTTQLVLPPAHWILALMTGGLYAVANAFERRGRSRALVTFVTILAAGVIMYISYLGVHALRL